VCVCHRMLVAGLALIRFDCLVIHLPQARTSHATEHLSQAALFDDKALLSEGLHPEQRAIEHEALEHMRRLTQ
jgi:hypothetical protein